MSRLVGAAGLVFAMLFAWSLWADGSLALRGQRAVASLALTILFAPTAAFWLGAESVHALWPRRALDRCSRFPVRRIASGVVGATLAAALAAVALVLLDQWLPDALITTLPAALSGAAVVALMTRARRGHCWSCGYDLSGATPASRGRCTECGATLMRAGV